LSRYFSSWSQSCRSVSKLIPPCEFPSSVTSPSTFRPSTPTTPPCFRHDRHLPCRCRGCSTNSEQRRTTRDNAARRLLLRRVRLQRLVYVRADSAVDRQSEQGGVSSYSSSTSSSSGQDQPSIMHRTVDLQQEPCDILRTTDQNTFISIR